MGAVLRWIMDNKKIISLVETLTNYLSDERENITAEALTSNRQVLDKITDAVIGLICKIGVDENFAPNIHGVILDGCLETLNEIREEYFKNE